MRISAKAEYSVRAAIGLAAAPTTPVKRAYITDQEEIPVSFLENILTDLRSAGIIESRRGSEGGYWLARGADEITLAELIRAVDGPLATIRGLSPEETSYDGVATPLQEVWVALRDHIRAVLESVTLADVVSGELPPDVRALISESA